MNNTYKLLRALIDALGFEVETIKPVPASEWSPGVIYDMQVTYKVTKKVIDPVPCKKCDGKGFWVAHKAAGDCSECKGTGEANESI